jgi:hypothetical protein
MDQLNMTWQLYCVPRAASSFPEVQVCEVEARQAIPAIARHLFESRR